MYEYFEDSKDWLVLDVETTNLQRGDPWTEGNKLLLACWFFRGRYYYSSGSEFEQHNLLHHIEEATVIVAHNAKFELGWLYRCGYDLASKPVFCTMVGQYVVSGNRRLPLSLNAVAEHYGLGSKESLVDQLIKRGVCPSALPETWLLEYCLQDVRLCLELAHRILAYCRNHQLVPVLFSRLSLTPVLTDIERVGMCLDEGRVDDKYRAAIAERGELRERMSEITGGINTNSNQQLTEYLFEVLRFKKPRDANNKLMETASGATSVSNAALDRLVPCNQRQREFLGLRKRLNKLEGLVSKYLQKMQDCCQESGGILRASFNQTITQTHRLSSSGKVYNIQLQNVNRNLKPLFKARNEGWYVMEVDYSQLEFRVAVDLADDEQGKKDILEGHDVHAHTASILFNEFKTATGSRKKALRTAAKADTFKPLFGGQSGTADQKRYYAEFKRRYKQISDTQDTWCHDALRTKELTLKPTGLKFFYPKAKLKEGGYIEESTRIRNAPIQSFASAEITLGAVMLMWTWLKDTGLQSFIVATIHDSIILEVHPDEVNTVSKFANRIMKEEVVEYIEKLYNHRIGVPLDIEVEYGQHWSEVV